MKPAKQASIVQENQAEWGGFDKRTWSGIRDMQRETNTQIHTNSKGEQIDCFCIDCIRLIANPFCVQGGGTPLCHFCSYSTTLLIPRLQRSPSYSSGTTLVDTGRMQSVNTLPRSTCSCSKCHRERHLAASQQTSLEIIHSSPTCDATGWTTCNSNLNSTEEVLSTSSWYLAERDSHDESHAWNQLNLQTVANGFRKSSILPTEECIASSSLIASPERLCLISSRVIAIDDNFDTNADNEAFV